MKTLIEASYGRTINLGDYESAKIHAGITEEIGEEDNRKYGEIFADLFKECENFVLEKCEKEVG